MTESSRLRVAVLGATGFVGGHAARAVVQGGHALVAVRAPRIVPRDARGWAAAAAEATSDLCPALRGSDVVVNAAGLAAPASETCAALTGANEWLPVVALAAAEAAGARRVVHVSSAAVQGRRAVLTEEWATEPFSPYSHSKSEGERRLMAASTSVERVVLRATSVHGAGRSTTESLIRFARSPFASVAGDGHAATPQVLVENVAAAVLHLVTAPHLPAVPVLQPWEGLTTGGLLTLLGGRRPRHVPTSAARLSLMAVETAGARSSRVTSMVRRARMVWLGQAQTEGWLVGEGWRPSQGMEAWQQLALRAREAD